MSFLIFQCFEHPTRVFKLLHKTVILRACDFFDFAQKGLLSTSPASQQPSCPLAAVLSLSTTLSYLSSRAKPTCPGVPWRDPRFSSQATNLNRKRHPPHCHPESSLVICTPKPNLLNPSTKPSSCLPRRAVGAKRPADLSHNEGLTARSRRTPAILVGRCYSELSGHSL